MKPFIPGAAAFVIAVLFQDCCKSYCPSEMMNVAFVGFTRNELDTLVIKKFEPGDFTRELGSKTIIIGGFSGDTLITSHMDSDGFDRKKSYEVSLPVASRSFRITDIKTKRYDCSCGQRNGRGVAGYTLDGSPITSDIVYLDK